MPRPTTLLDSLALLRPTLVIDVRAAIISAAAEHVRCAETPQAALRAAMSHDDIEARDALAEVLGRSPSQTERHALVRAIRYEARKFAESLIADDDCPEAWGTARAEIDAALDRDADDVAACDDCEGRGLDEHGDLCGCHGGLVTDDVTGLLLRLRDEALAACVAAVGGKVAA